MPIRPQIVRLLVVASFLACVWVPRAARAAPFSDAWLRGQAKALSEKDYEPPSLITDALAGLDYDSLRNLRFKPDQAYWKNQKLPFQLQFFHVGGHVRESIEINTVRRGQAVPLAFNPAYFDASRVNLPPEALAKAGFAGFRAHAAINNPQYLDEVLVFLGASYFRSLGKDQLYGLSARGLALDTALPSGEEFPRFTKFWIEEPAPKATTIVVHALLDSPSVTGAYRFKVTPGVETVMDVTATLFPRKDLNQLGVAPLTSMYLHGENDRSSIEDFRPEVHDSDGVLLWTGSGERLWRPLSNPGRLQVSSFEVGAVKGFGLLQRDTHYPDYEDLEAHYERRPSLWVEPRSGFENGRVMLVEIPTPEEIHDNIGAFFVPAKPAERGDELKFAYRLHWGQPTVVPAGPVREVIATRTSAGSTQKQRKFVIDFSAYRATPKNAKPGDTYEAVVSVNGAKVIRPLTQTNSVTGGVRVTFELQPEETGPLELRCFIKRNNEPDSETWSYLWTP